MTIHTMRLGLGVLFLLLAAAILARRLGIPAVVGLGNGR